MITSLIEMLELPNFGHMTTSATEFESRNKILLVTSWTKIMTSWPLFQNTCILKRPQEAIFADIIKIVTIFIKAILKDSKKIIRLKNYVSKCNLCLHFFI